MADPGRVGGQRHKQLWSSVPRELPLPESKVFQHIRDLVSPRLPSKTLAKSELCHQLSVHTGQSHTHERKKSLLVRKFQNFRNLTATSCRLLESDRTLALPQKTSSEYRPTFQTAQVLSRVSDPLAEKATDDVRKFPYRRAGGSSWQSVLVPPECIRIG